MDASGIYALKRNSSCRADDILLSPRTAETASPRRGGACSPGGTQYGDSTYHQRDPTSLIDVSDISPSCAPARGYYNSAVPRLQNNGWGSSRSQEQERVSGELLNRSSSLYGDILSSGDQSYLNVLSTSFSASCLSSSTSPLGAALSPPYCTASPDSASPRPSNSTLPYSQLASTSTYPTNLVSPMRLQYPVESPPTPPTQTCPDFMTEHRTGVPKGVLLSPVVIKPMPSKAGYATSHSPPNTIQIQDGNKLIQRPSQLKAIPGAQSVRSMSSLKHTSKSDGLVGQGAYPGQPYRPGQGQAQMPRGTIATNSRNFSAPSQGGMIGGGVFPTRLEHSVSAEASVRCSEDREVWEESSPRSFGSPGGGRPQVERNVAGKLNPRQPFAEPFREEGENCEDILGELGDPNRSLL